jgi:hypothetical protein
MSDEQEYVNVKTFARLAGLSDSTVLLWLKLGRIIGATQEVFGRPDWRISVEANRELIEQQRLLPRRRRRAKLD